METETPKIQFVPFSSVVSSSFWEAFSKLKLNDLRLSTDPVPIKGIFSRRIVEGVSPLFHLQHDSLSETIPQSDEILTPGTLINTNTIEEFKKRDKAELLNTVASQIWEAILTGEAENNPSVLLSFLFYIYADLKKYQFYYWFAFPAFVYPASISLLSPLQTLSQKIQDKQLATKIDNCLKGYAGDASYFTLVIKDGGEVEVLPLGAYYQSVQSKEDGSEVWLCFSDPSNSPSHPGWPLRNLLTLAAVKWKDVQTHTVLGLREKSTPPPQGLTWMFSLVFNVRICDGEGGQEPPACLGWEKNERGKMGPKFSNMIKTMDPTRISESAVDLNLRLMKWRLDPALDLEAIKGCSCLLFGAGTLGCNVARGLLGWGVHTLTLVDRGHVSYSNPVRQSLFTFDDCLCQENPKAEVAAKALKKIFPRVNSTGIVLSIPMPGHTIDTQQMEKVVEDIRKLEELVESHDMIFLLTDSRESRWLPSLLGAAMKKTVLTSALGFDSYLVMRHGIRGCEESAEAEADVGCYFCNDVVAPGDSTSDRTLDQQCTVTRPGMSFMAAGQAVEMMVDILQRAVKCKKGGSDLPQVPHSIRYYLATRHQLVTSSPPFTNCSACSHHVLSAYKKDGVDFLVKVLNCPGYLEQVSGLAKLHEDSQAMEILELSDSEED